MIGTLVNTGAIPGGGAMPVKLINEIVAEEDGTIAEICVRNGQVVEYGTVLFRLGEEK